MLPDGDYLYACDNRWWRYHKDAVQAQFSGKKYYPVDADRQNLIDPHIVADLDMFGVAASFGGGFDPTQIKYGPRDGSANSTYQALTLAFLLGAEYVVLLGLDLSAGHFFGDHPPEIRGPNEHSRQKNAFKTFPKDKQVFNASPTSKLDVFPKYTLSEIFDD